LLLPIAASQSRSTTYLASVRLLMPQSDQSSSEVTADTVAAIATSRSEVASALRAARADRDPGAFGANNVSVQPVGNSGILDISVSDDDPKIAAAVANSLTARVVEVTTKVSTSQQQGVVDALTEQVATIGRQIEELASQAQHASSSQAAALDARRELLIQDRSSFESQLAQLQSQLAQSPRPSVIDSASATSARAIPPTRAQDVALGGLFGLVVGLAAAALLEALNPTVMGEDAIASELGVPVLGVLPSTKLSWLRWRLEMQARRTGVATIELTTAGPSINLAPLSTALHRAGAPADVVVGSDGETRSGDVSSKRRRRATTATAHANAGGSSMDIRVLDQGSARSIDPSRRGIVVVTPTAVKRTDIEPVKDLLQVTDWPMLGLIGYRRIGLPLQFRGIAERVKAFRSRIRLGAFRPWQPRP
jgi:capsular polysaccharide biosynthesis protein